MMKIKKVSTLIALSAMLLINSKTMALANEEVNINGIVSALSEAEIGGAPLAKRLVISDVEQQLYEKIEKLLTERGIEESTDGYTWVSVPLETDKPQNDEVQLLEITKDQYATYLSYQLNDEIYQLTYYANGTINKKITMYYTEEDYVYTENHNNEVLSAGDSSELDNSETDQEDPVIVDLKETKVQLQQRLDILAIIFATGLFAVIMCIVWGRNLLLRK